MNNNFLRKHHLTHIPELKIDESVFNLRFSSVCDMRNCKGECCQWGVFTDISERDKILAHADLIIRYMEPHQEHNPQLWFEKNEISDTDFPSGRSVGTQAFDYGCVFLDSAGLCALQKACTAEGISPFTLKPFYCVAYPLTIENGVLMIDDVELKNGTPCQIIKSDGILTIFEIGAVELDYVLGKEGVKELYNLLKINNHSSC
ncbi:MAG: DUF3109 family protein [Bacteroidota bacterium]|nr:DUF3109 family protein [Bacteroidota bacterium]